MEYKHSLTKREEEFKKTQNHLQEEIHNLKEDLKNIESERDAIISQAEGSYFNFCFYWTVQP